MPAASEWSKQRESARAVRVKRDEIRKAKRKEIRQKLANIFESPAGQAFLQSLAASGRFVLLVRDGLYRQGDEELFGMSCMGPTRRAWDRTSQDLMVGSLEYALETPISYEDLAEKIEEELWLFAEGEDEEELYDKEKERCIFSHLPRK